MEEESQSLLLEAVNASEEKTDKGPNRQIIDTKSSFKGPCKNPGPLKQNDYNGLQNRDLVSPIPHMSRGINHLISSQITSQIKQNTDPPIAVVVPTMLLPQVKYESPVKETSNVEDRQRGYSVGYEKNFESFLADLDDDFDEGIFKTQEQKANKGNPAKGFVGKQNQYLGDKTDIEIMDSSGFEVDQDNIETLDPNYMEMVNDVNSDGDSDMSGNGSPVLTLTSKISKRSLLI